MTLLLACASPEGLIIAGDIYTTSGHQLNETAKSKWVKSGGWHIGYSGSAMFGQALEWNAGPTHMNHVKDVVSWMRAIFMQNGLSPTKEEGVDKFDAHFLLARNKDVYRLDTFLYATKFEEGAWATLGSASEYANGCLDMVTEAGSPWAPSDIARVVITMAEKKYATVNGCKVDVIPYGPQGVSVVRTSSRGTMEVPE